MFSLFAVMVQKLGRVLIVTTLITHLTGCAFDSQTMDLRSIDRSVSPNDGLACSLGICHAKFDIESPTFALPKNIMMERVKAIITAEPRTKLVGIDLGLDQLVFVQRSALLGFPDTIWIQGAYVDTRASIIIYSRSNYGYWDFGVNRDRVRTWLAKLGRAMRKDRLQKPGKY